MKITVRVKQGVVIGVSIDGTPTPAEVLDYDTDTYDEDRIEIDEAGLPVFVYEV